MWALLLGGLGGGFANDYGLVLLARVAEGLAAGVVQPIPAIIILRAFAPGEQGRASGLFRCFRSALGECLFAPVEPVAESAPVGLFGGNCPGGNCGTATGWGWRR